MAVPVDVIPRRPTLLFIVVLSVLFALMAASSRTRAGGQTFTMPTTMAEAVMLDISGRFKSIIVDRGSSAGIDVDDAVVNANGLIGRVVLTTKDMAKVQLVTDSNSSVGVLIERTRRQGVLRG